jgi:hypothetical protein
MWRRWALIIIMMAMVVVRGEEDEKKKVERGSDVKEMTDLVGLTDDELYAIFSDPGPDPGHLPSQV